jgi:hypothetical protein
MRSLSEQRPDDVIAPGVRAYFQERFRNRLFTIVIREFISARDSGLTQKQLAKRLGKRPEQINRLLSAPGNWTLDTCSDLLLGINAQEPNVTISSVYAEATSEVLDKGDLVEPEVGTQVMPLDQSQNMIHFLAISGAANENLASQNQVIYR